ncbi:MAG: hypothetical protein GY862_13610 [Gammaproteobacteria bacterium]|nr:hypothetical protein [Gammaproteobacteria bacterium]
MIPIKKVVLFKHGIGHFEREGKISGDTSVELHFRASEMNDVLKSLTVLDLDGGLVSSISYESTLPVDKQLQDIAIRLPEKNAFSGLFSQIQGASIAIETGQSTVTGTVTGIETVKRRADGTVFESPYVILLVEGGSLQAFELLEAKRIDFLDENLKKDLQHLLNVLINAKKKDLKKLTVFAKGEGERTLNISYLIESPVWKTSYRLLLNEGSSPLIQGWALVDNTQDEDWENVSLSLVAGLPISFVHDLYSPRHKQRPVIHVKEEAAYAPPELEEALEDMTLDFAEMERAGVPAAPAAMAMKKAGTRGMSRKMAREHSASVHTRTVEAGDLFQYEIKNPVSVHRHQSALVPILQAGFEGKRVAVYNPEVRDKNPMSAVLFKNTTGLTLENGPLTVFEDEAYAGEAMLNILKPDEEQLVPFSVELGCVISVDPGSKREPVHQTAILHGFMHLYSYDIETKTYIIKNKTARKLDLFLEHRFNPGWKLADTLAPIERTENFYRFRFDVDARQTKRFTVIERISRTNKYALEETSRETLKLWISRKYIEDEKTRKLLETVVQRVEQGTRLQQDINTRESAIKDIFHNQERLRKNLQSLGSSRDERGLRERYIASLAEEEDKLAQYRAEIQALKSRKNAAEKELHEQIKGINMN